MIYSVALSAPGNARRLTLLSGLIFSWLTLFGGSRVFGQPNSIWLPMPMVDQTELNAGIFPGGEGCQYPQMIAMDATDGSFILYATDVGGLYRSIDGGNRFQPCNVGIENCGAVGFAIDPSNKNRCLAVGDGQGNQYNIFGGVYLSTNQGAIWSNQLSKWLNANGNNWNGGSLYWSSHGREQIAFDPGSYNTHFGYCTVAYWVEEGNPQEAGGNLYKTVNGGQFWSLIGSPAAYGGSDNGHSMVKVSPTGGNLYIANTNGFYLSVNKGSSFTKILSGSFWSLDVSVAAPANVWTTSGNTIYLSTNFGASFTSFQASGVGNFLSLKVSPVNVLNMLASDQNADNQRFYSHDGGQTWYPCGQNMALSWIPPSILYNDRCIANAWSPTNPSAAFMTGPGDIITSTTNAGVTMQWQNNGNNGIDLGASFNFNTQNPSLLYIGSQDYNGALTSDGGNSWQFIDLSAGNNGSEFGWVYGAYAADSQTLFGGNRAYLSSVYQLWITFDGGKTASSKVSNLTGLQTCYGAPNNTNVLFCWSYRSSNRGTNWTQMTGCQGVLTHNPSNDTLYGANGKSVVSSTDLGVTWNTVTTLSAAVNDVSVDQNSGTLWVVASGQLWKCTSPAYTPVAVTQPNSSALSVSVDPQNPQIIYVAGTPGNFDKGSSCVVMSTNGGTSWSSLNNRTDTLYDGGNCAIWCRVHPLTRELWVGTSCYGMWRFGSPPAISSQPTNQTATVGQSVTFTVSTTGSGPQFYQWLLNGTNIAGATSANYTISSVQTGNAGNYSVEVSNVTTGVTSSNATLTVNVPQNVAPTITTQPTDISVNQGDNITFMVVATGTPSPTYQWAFNGTNIVGANGSMLTLNDVQVANAGDYSVLVTNLAGSVTSSNAVLTVDVPPAITAQPADVSVNQGGNATFTVVATGTPSPSYQWAFNGTNIEGANGSTLALNNVQVVNAGSYSVLVSNVDGSVTSSNAVLTVYVPPAITLQPTAVSVNQGENATFTVVASGIPSPSYQWSFNGTNIAGATSNILPLSNVQTSNAGSYSVLITNLAGSVTSSNALLIVTVVPPVLSGLVPLAGGGIQFQVSGSPGNYTIEGSTDLVDWIVLTNFVSTGNSFLFSDPQKGLPLRFYQALLSQ
jgi:hypothetical protein